MHQAEMAQCDLPGERSNRALSWSRVAVAQKFHHCGQNRHVRAVDKIARARTSFLRTARVYQNRALRPVGEVRAASGFSAT